MSDAGPIGRGSGEEKPAASPRGMQPSSTRGHNFRVLVIMLFSLSLDSNLSRSPRFLACGC